MRLAIDDDGWRSERVENPIERMEVAPMLLNQLLRRRLLVAAQCAPLFRVLVVGQSGSLRVQAGAVVYHDNYACNAPLEEPIRRIRS